MDNIEKLREKLEKDPSSTLFVPLAEEYKKAGMLDEAIKVLKDGIEKKPGYMSARVSLGKVYLEKGMKQEAAEEFTKVVDAIPDNFYAHKKLAEIYRDQNDIPRAMEELKTLLALNAKDEEALAALKELEERAAGAGEVQAAPKEEAPEKPAEEVEEFGIDLSPVQAEEPAPEEEAGPGEFLLSIADREALEEPGKESAKEAEEMKPRPREYDEEPSIRQPLTGAEAEAEAFWMPVEEGDEDWKVGPPPEAEPTVEEVSASELEVEGEPPPPLESAEEDMMEFPGLGDEVEEEVPEVEEIAQPMEEIVPEAEETVQEAVEEAAPPEVETPQMAEEAFPEIEETAYEAQDAAHRADVPQDRGSDGLSRADDLINSEEYGKAMEIYRRLLAQNPDDRVVLQKVEELKALLKVLGRDRDAVVARLDAFLGAIQRRKDEFFTSP